MDNTFFDGHDELYHHAKFGEGRTTRAGCKCENVVFFSLFVCHAPRPRHCASEGCVVRTSIASAFIVRFRRGLQIFFQKGLLFKVRYIVFISVARWRHSIREIAVKNCETPKNRRKSCAHHSCAKYFVVTGRLPRQPDGIKLIYSVRQ